MKRPTRGDTGLTPRVSDPNKSEAAMRIYRQAGHSCLDGSGFRPGLIQPGTYYASMLPTRARLQSFPPHPRRQ